MEEDLLFVQIEVANVQDIYRFTFTGPKSAIIFDKYDFIWTQIWLLIDLCLPRIFE